MRPWRFENAKRVATIFHQLAAGVVSPEIGWIPLGESHFLNENGTVLYSKVLGWCVKVTTGPLSESSSGASSDGVVCVTGV
jgi:hypothetical protein